MTALFTPLPPGLAGWVNSTNVELCLSTSVEIFCNNANTRMVRAKELQMTDEKKPPQGGGMKSNGMGQNLIQLTGIGLLVLEPTSGGGVIVHAMGAKYSEAPTCRQAVDAALTWVGSIDRENTATGTSLSPAEFEYSGAHLNAFIDEIDASFFWHRQMPPVVVVPGVGRWVFVCDSAAARLSPQDRAGLMAREAFGQPSQTLLHPLGHCEDQPL